MEWSLHADNSRPVVWSSYNYDIEWLAIMTESSKPRQDGTAFNEDWDKLVLVEPDKLNWNFVEKSTHDAALARIKLLEEVCAELMGALKIVTIQSTSKEYEEECNDSLDGQTAIEAWDSLITETRQALASAREKIGGGE